MTDSVDSLGETSHAMVEASDRGQEVIEGLSLVQKEIGNMGELITEAVGKVVEEMERLTTIVETIDNIANQTKLLAINAAIESARMGERGKAFAVIAEEIRQLATESASSLENVRDIVEKIDERFEELRKVAGEIGEVGDKAEESTKNVLEEFSKIKDLLNVVNSAVEEVVASIEEVKAGIDDISQNVTRVLTG